MTARALAPWLALALALPSVVRAQEPPPDSLVESVEVGFHGVATHRIPASLWVTLHNRRDRELDLTVVMKSAIGATERAVQLPSGAKKRVNLALALEGQLLLEVRAGGRLLEERTLPFGLQDTERHLLVLDGRPPDRRAGALEQHEDQVLRYTTIDAEAAPTEASCYAGVAAVLLREVDPATWTVDQREALLEHVREGGLLLIAGATPKVPTTMRHFEGLPAGPTETQKVAGRPVRVRRLGFGRVMAFADDPLAATQAGPQAADVKQRLGELLFQATQGRRWPRPFDEPYPSLEQHPGVPTQLLVVGFLFAYLLAVGPVLGLAFRRARRQRVAVAVGVLVGGFTLVAPLVAGVVRNGRGQARHRVVVWVPAQGPAVELGDVRIVSGGATSYDVELDGGGGSVSATLVESVTAADDPFQSMTGQMWVGARPVAVRTVRGDRARVTARMPLWSEQHIFTQALRPEVRRVESRLTGGANGFVASIQNDTGADLEDAVIVEEVEFQPAHPYVHVGRIPAGERRDVVLPRALQARSPPLSERLDIPYDWTGWLEIGVAQAPAPTRGRGRSAAPHAPRYRLASRARARVQVGGPNLESVVHALRLDPLQQAPAAAQGFLGAVLADVEETRVCVRCDAPLTPRRDCSKCRARSHTQKRVQLDPVAGGPCARAQVQKGDVLLRLDGARVASSDQLRALVRDRAPGDVLVLTIRGTDGATRDVRVVLARASGGSQ